MNGVDACPTTRSVQRSRRWFLRSLAGVATAGFPLLASRLSADEPAAGTFIENPCAVMNLPSGRRIAYAEYGDPAGPNVIIHHHGVPSCRLEAEIFLPAVRGQRGVRLICLDRPGVGRSDPDPASSFLNWPADVAAFADSLNLNRFAIMATSGGTPYALAAAHALPKRVRCVSLACPMAPLEAADYGICHGARGAIFSGRHPLAARTAMNQLGAALQRNPNRTPLWLRCIGPVDMAMFDDPNTQALFVRITTEAFRQGSDDLARLAAELAEPWSCWLKGVQTQVSIYQGGCDRITTPGMARYLAATLPNATLRFYPNEGHLSLPYNQAADILAGALKPPAKDPGLLSRR